MKTFCGQSRPSSRGYGAHIQHVNWPELCVLLLVVERFLVVVVERYTCICEGSPRSSQEEYTTRDFVSNNEKTAK